MSLAPLPPSNPNNYRSPALEKIPTLEDSPNSNHADFGESNGRRFPLYLLLIGIVGAVLAAGVLVFVFSGRSKTNRPDLLLHTVKLEDLDLTVVERGALESADN